jgi:16S rRNA (cytosine1402-N4)-methyltransferase
MNGGSRRLMRAAAIRIRNNVPSESGKEHRAELTAPPAAAELPHVPVMLREALSCLDVRPGGVYVDGTFGAGGYARAILETPQSRVIGIDRDPDAIARGRQLEEAAGGRLQLWQGRFSAMEEALAEAGVAPGEVDGVVLDLGVSSMQLDEGERGFSFLHDGPLDMRMEKAGPSAADIVNEAGEELLAAILRAYGEERRARAIARAIVRARQEAPILTTGRLAEIVCGVLGPRRPGESHPATRTFQALRIFVNRELEELVGGLAAAERVLRPGGRLVVVSFHSLEDRIVKRFFAERTGRLKDPALRHLPVVEERAPSFIDVARGGITPDAEEVAANPRARSARLRAGERTDAPPLPPDPERLGLPRIARKGRGGSGGRKGGRR